MKHPWSNSFSTNHPLVMQNLEQRLQAYEKAKRDIDLIVNGKTVDNNNPFLLSVIFDAEPNQTLLEYVLSSHFENSYWLAKICLKYDCIEGAKTLLERKSLGISTGILLCRISRRHHGFPIIPNISTQTMTTDPFFISSNSEEASRCLLRQTLLARAERGEDLELDLELFSENDDDLMDALFQCLSKGNIPLYISFIQQVDLMTVIDMLLTDDDARMLQVLLLGARWNNSNPIIRTFNHALLDKLQPLRHHFPYNITPLLRRLG